MRTRDVHATTAGLLFIAATAASLVATAFLGSVLKGPGFLATVAGGVQVQCRGPARANSGHAHPGADRRHAGRPAA